MAKTPLTGSSAYCTAAQAVERVDVRILGDYLSDTGTRLTPGEVAASTRLGTLLSEASGMIEAACIKGRRYTPTDLAALTNNSLEYLRGITAGLALWLAFERRPERFAGHKMPARAEYAMAQLEMLAMGERIFGFTETADAGLPDHEQETVADFEALGGLVNAIRPLLGKRAREFDQP